MLWRGYDGVFHTNEHALLERQVGAGCTGGLHLASVRHLADYDLYAVDRHCSLT